MKAPNLIHHPRSAGLTRTELLCLVFILVVLAGFCPCTFSRAGKKGLMVDSLNNAKQIGTALMMFSGDHDGRFPFARLDGTAPGPGDSSNRALENLMPKYSSTKLIFSNKASAWCRNPVANTTADSHILRRGQNDWNYVVGLTEKSDPRWPLMATATTSATDLTYTDDKTAKGGVWDGTDAVIVYADGRARMERCDGSANVAAKTKTFPKRPDTGASIFTATPEWLGVGRVILAPE